MRLRKNHLLPAKARKLANVIKENQPVNKEELKQLVEDKDSLDIENFTCNFKLLRMTDNLVIEDGKASIDFIQCGESDEHILEKFRRWKNS